MTAPVPLVERLAEVNIEALSAHEYPTETDDGLVMRCTCGATPPTHLHGAQVDAALWLWRHRMDEAARALLPVVEQAVAEARGEALREAAKEAEERGDIGKDGGPEAWTWLRIRAGRIGGAE